MAERRITWIAKFQTLAAQREAHRLAEKLEDNEKATARANRAQKDYSGTLDKSTTNTRTLSRALSDVAKSQKKSREETERAAAILNKVKRAEADAAIATEKLTKAQQSQKASAGQLARAQALVEHHTLRARRATDEYNRELSGSTKKVDDHGNALSRLSKKQGGAAQTIRNAFTWMKALKLVLVPLVGLIPAVATAISSLAAGAVALVSALGPLSGFVAALPAGFVLLGQTIGSVVLAFSGLGDAIKANLEALKATTPEQAIAANEKLAEAYKNMTPTAIAFTEQLVGMKTKLDALKASVQDAALPFFSDALREATPLLDAFHGALSRTASVVGRSASAGASMMAAGPFRADLVTIMDTNSKALGRLLDGFWNFIDALRHVTVAARPMILWMSDVIKRWGEMAVGAARAGRETGAMAAFFQRSVEVAQMLGGVLRNVWDILIGIGRAATGLGNDLWDGIEQGTASMAALVNSAKGQNALKAWFDAAREPLRQMWLLVKAVGTAFNDLAVGGQGGLTPLIETLRTKLLPLLVNILNSIGQGLTPAFLDLINSLVDLFTEMGGALTIVMTVMARFIEAVTWLITNVPFASEALTTFMVILTGMKIKNAVSNMGSLKDSITLVRSGFAKAIPIVKNWIAAMTLAASGPGGLGAIATGAGVAAGALAALGVAVIGTGKILTDAWSDNLDRQRSALSDSENLLRAYANNVVGAGGADSHSLEAFKNQYESLMSMDDISAEQKKDLTAVYEMLVLQIENGVDVIGTASQETHELANAEEEAAEKAKANAKAQKRQENALYRVADAFRAVSANQKAAQREATAASEASALAQEGLADAHESVRDAQQSLADAHEGVADAQTQLADSHVAVQDAQEALTEARKNATEALIDLRLEVARMGHEEESSKLSLLSSRQALMDTMNDENSTAISRRQAVLAVRSAEFSYQDTLRENKRTREDLSEAERKGVEGSDAVVSARKALRDSIEAASDAQRGLKSAIEGVSDAQRSLVKSQRDVVTAQKAAAQAQRNNTRAQEALAKATEKSNRLMRKMMESGVFDDIKDEYKGLAEEGKGYMEDLKTATGTEIATIVAKFAGWQRRSTEFASKIGGVMESMKKGVGGPLAYVQKEIIEKFLKNIDNISGAFGKNLKIPELDTIHYHGAGTAGGPQQYHEGGEVGKDGTPHKGPIRSNEEVAVLEKGERVISRKHLPPSRNRRRRGAPDTPAAKTLGASTFQSIMAYAAKTGIPHAVTSTNEYRGSGTYHDQSKAVDFAADPANMLRLNKAFAKISSYMTELIYTPGINLWHGQPHTYSAETAADHWDHVHVASIYQLWDAIQGKIPDVAYGTGRGTGGGELQAALKKLSQDINKMEDKGMMGAMAGTMGLFTGKWAKQWLKGPHLYKGGAVSGPEAGRDRIPAMLSDGEYVLRRAAVAKIGRYNLDLMNDDASSFFQGLATGGFVSPAAAPAVTGSRVHSVTSSEAGQSGSGGSGRPTTIELEVEGVTLTKTVNLTNDRNKILLKNRV